MFDRTPAGLELQEPCVGAVTLVRCSHAALLQQMFYRPRTINTLIEIGLNWIEIVVLCLTESESTEVP